MLQVNEIDYCKVQVIYEADSSKIEEKRELVLREFKDVRVPGFRPGKASVEAIKMTCKKQIEERLRSVLAQEAYDTAINEGSIKPLGQPHFNDLKLTSDTFLCEFTLNKQPEFELGQYKEFELPKPAAQLSEAEFAEKIIQQVRTQNGESLPFTDDDFAQDGDSVIVDYEVMVDGNPAPEINGTKEVITIGQSPIPAFDQNLLGMKSGETREFDIPTPENTPEQYKNKTLHFKVTLAMGSKSVPAPLDEELAIKLKFKSIDELRDNVSAMASSRIAEHQSNMIGQQLQKRICDTHQFKIPDWIILSEAQMQAKNLKKEWEKISDEDKEVLMKRSEDAVRVSFILEKVRELEPEAQLSDEETVSIIKDNLGKMAQNNGSIEDVDTLLNNMSKNGLLPMLVGRVRDEHTLQFLVRTCKIID